jgi:signal transduction histidine kinase
VSLPRAAVSFAGRKESSVTGTVEREAPLDRLGGRPAPGMPSRYPVSFAALAGALVIGAVAAVVLPLSTGVLRYPGWFAAQRAALILGPALVGLYWERRRPGGRFGRMLIGLGVLAIPLSLEATRSPWPHLVGVVAEAPLLFATFVVVLAFPAGRLGRLERGILAVLLVSYVAWYLPYFLFAPVVSGGPLSVCGRACPPNPLQVASHPVFLRRFSDVYSAIGVAVSIAVAAIVLGGLGRARPPRRRALLIGSLLAALLLVVFAIYVATNMSVPLATSALGPPVRWLLPALRAALPLGYLIALVDAELYAGRLVADIVDRALHSSLLQDVTRTLPAAIGDPELTFGFWVPGRGWVRTDGEPFAEPSDESGRVMTTIDREGRPLAAVVHRAQLEESPELIRAIVATSLLIVENATLEAELRLAIRDLRESRARVIRAGDLERRRIERDLHDGAQQRLIALRMKLQGDEEALPGAAPQRERLAELRLEVDRALAEIRELAHGIFPPLLADRGLVAALRAAALTSPLGVELTADLPRERYPLELEAAVYFCMAEALQNATKHAGADAAVTIAVTDAAGALQFLVSDDGVGFDPSGTAERGGLTGMQDRLGAFGGEVVIESAPGRGTVVRGRVPVLTLELLP